MPKVSFSFFVDRRTFEEIPPDSVASLQERWLWKKLMAWGLSLVVTILLWCMVRRNAFLRAHCTRTYKSEGGFPGKKYKTKKPDFGRKIDKLY